jgi:hypothetical protein
MEVNIFFCNGFMSALASSFIADHLKVLNPNSISYLCIEQNSKGGSVYYEVLDILVVQNKHFKKVIRVKTEFRDLSFRKPVEYVRNLLYYKKLAIVASDLFGDNFRTIKTIIWAPTVTRLWPFFKKRGDKFNLIEHGLGEYCKANSHKRTNLRHKLLGYLRQVFGYNGTDISNSIWLCSNAVRFPLDEHIVQINFAELFVKYVDSFWLDYQKQFPVAAKELLLIASQIQNFRSDAYLYLPSDEIRYEEYGQFAKEQIDVLGLQKKMLVIKKHPGDIHANYEECLAQHAIIINITELENCYMPAEFIAHILNIRNVVGSASSALFYLKSWLPDVSVHIYNDYDEKLLTYQSREIKKQLSELGLVNKYVTL